MIPIRLFVVDDHPVVLMGVASMFDNEPDIDVVGSAASAREALEQIPQLDVDVLLTDLRMKSMGGDEFASELRKTHPNLRVGVLTNFHSDEDVFKAMRAGVRAFLLKSAPIEEVIAAVRMMHAGERWIPPHIAQQLAERVARQQLSSRELEILQLIANGLKNREIAEALSISENTVRNHVNNLMEKLDSRDRTEAVTMAVRQGVVRLDKD
jgi:DNA-binding NarL/FixJ family response regulator